MDNTGGLKHPCIACMEPQASIVILHRENGMRVTRMDGSPLQYCRKHWDFMMEISPAGMKYEIELL